MNSSDGFVLITGGSGLIGAAVTERLKDRLKTGCLDVLLLYL